ncbi:hypothetical protein DPQ25_11855 [Hydrogeniiclostridium mannosilyticum]|uniref:Uncharacterized protein n=1 Tax=Hydrogeniiclostridium mannosilyticum TaxID=2764322 RepID=A0A328UAJ9_9FIRM|nr:hypothetical protein DPQ25_11855 [Hydrogeniiclostridium mannosilyticum]
MRPGLALGCKNPLYNLYSGFFYLKCAGISDIMKELYFRLFLASGYPDDEKLGEGRFRLRHTEKFFLGGSFF